MRTREYVSVTLFMTSGLVAAWIGNACVRITDDCTSLRISPSGGAAVVGDTLRFRALREGLPTPCSWTWTDENAAVVPTGLDGEVDVITTGLTDNFDLIAETPDGLKCITQVAMVDVSGTTGTTQPYPSPNTTPMTVWAGAVAVGGTPAPTALLLGPVGEVVYIATLVEEPNISAGSTPLVDMVERFRLDDILAGNFIPTFTTQGLAKFSTGFGQGFGPNIAADSAGNGYWFGSSDLIYRIGATQVLGDTPLVRSLGQVAGLTFAAPRLAIDSQQRLYFPGIYTPPGGSPSQGYLRVTGLFGMGAVTVEPIILSNIFEAALQIAIDRRDRVYATQSGDLKRFVEVAPGNFQEIVDPPGTAARDRRGFDSTAALTVDGVNLVDQISDLDVDGKDQVYVTISLEVGYQVRVLNSSGDLIRAFTVIPGTDDALDGLYSLAASGSGSLLFYDGADGADAGTTPEQGLLSTFDPDTPNVPPSDGIGF